MCRRYYCTIYKKTDRQFYPIGLSAAMAKRRFKLNMTPFRLCSPFVAEKLLIRELTAFLSVTFAQNVVLFSRSMKIRTSTGNPLEIKLFLCCPNYNTLTCPGRCRRSFQRIVFSLEPGQSRLVAAFDQTVQGCDLLRSESQAGDDFGRQPGWFCKGQNENSKRDKRDETIVK